MKIIFDFDYTLFSARKFYQTFENEFKKIGVSKKLFKETFEESKGKGRDYKPSRQFDLIIKKNPKISLKKLKESFKKILSKANDFLYPDVEPFLKKIENKLDLFLLSYGDKNFQREKIKKSDIAKFFKKVFITSDVNKASTFKKIMVPTSKRGLKEKTIFIDDNPAALSAVKEKFPKVITIRMNRGEGRYKKEKSNQNIDFSVKNLKELEKILHQI